MVGAAAVLGGVTRMTGELPMLFIIPCESAFYDIIRVRKVPNLENSNHQEYLMD